MKLIHLFEDDEPLQTPTNLNQLKLFLSSNCQPYLTQFKNCRKPLLRGMKPAIDVFIVTTPVGRAPSNTPIKFHTIADDWFNENFGHRYRSNAVFCTGRRKQAEAYGSPHWVFPIGEFKMCWSPQVKDLYFLIRDKYCFYSIPKSHQATIGPVKEEFVKLLKNYNYKEGPVKTAINSNCEVMVACEKYLCIADEYAQQHNLMEEIQRL
jgi:hypothetical protein